MSTRIALAKKGKITEEMKLVAEDEDLLPSLLAKRIARGTAVILKNVIRDIPRPIGIGEGLRTKVNVNVGTSPDLCDPSLEVKKAKVAVKYGADTIMDLSTAGNLDEIRRKLLKVVKAPFGTVPIYQAAIESAMKKGSFLGMNEDDIFDVIKRHAKDGVDFMTVHCGVTKEIVDYVVKHPRVMGIVSRGGAFLATWIRHNEKENPLYENYDYLLEIAREYDVTLSLGDGLRPGSIFDAMDHAQVQELLAVGNLVKRAREANVQAMVEGPGHLPIDQIEANVKLAKSVSGNAPFYVLGPLVTDIAPGYDHIVSAIGGAVAATYGADFLCCVARSEHLGIPLVEDIKSSVIAARIAAHSADIAKLGPKASEWDARMDSARAKIDWAKQFEEAIDPQLARKIHERVKPKDIRTCTMCGKWCALRMFEPRRKSIPLCSP